MRNLFIDVMDVSINKQARSWRKQDLGNLKRGVRKLERMLVETFNKHLNSGQLFPSTIYLTTAWNIYKDIEHYLYCIPAYTIILVCTSSRSIAKLWTEKREKMIETVNMK